MTARASGPDPRYAGCMAKPASRNPVADIVYLVVFGGFTGFSLYQLITGTGTRFTWFFLGAGAVLFAATAYRMYRNFTRSGA
jgi:hypothetical protein